MPTFSRRDFLKMGAAVTSGILFPRLVSKEIKGRVPEDLTKPNVIILLFDALSARNISLYGYARPTTPNFERLAKRCNVYQSHYAGGNFTIPGVSTLLTGTYPWTHRALTHTGAVSDSMAGNNIFHAFGSDYYRLAFLESVWAEFIVSQFAKDVDQLLPPGTWAELDSLLGPNFPRDRDVANRALDDYMFKTDIIPPSLLLGSIQRVLMTRSAASIDLAGYPRGLPQNVNYPLYFRLERVFGGLAKLLPTLPRPFFSYLHLFPPHAPYKPTAKFSNSFKDIPVIVHKPMHRLADVKTDDQLAVARLTYDRYIASVDWELGNLLDSWEESGILETSYLVITADHGEMFERGEKAHDTPLLYDPVVHIPLLISSPGQQSRRDIYAPTSAVDILPTLLNLVGKPIPSWCEGKPLPGLGGVEDDQRSTYVVEAKRNSAFAPLKKATFVLRQGHHKLIYYTGYEMQDSFELYDLDADLEEMNDLYPSLPAFGKKMKQELLETLFRVNAPYVK